MKEAPEQCSKLASQCFELVGFSALAFYLFQLQLSQLCMLFLVLEAGRTLQVSISNKESMSILEYRNHDKTASCTRVRDGTVRVSHSLALSGPQDH